MQGNQKNGNLKKARKGGIRAAICDFEVAAIRFSGVRQTAAKGIIKWDVYKRKQTRANADKRRFHSPWSLGIIERGVPQAYVCARASSATLCSVHVLRVFLFISRRESDTYQNVLGYIFDTYPNPYPPYDYSNEMGPKKRTNADKREQTQNRRITTPFT